MHRNRDAGLEQARGASRLQRIHVPGAQRGPPSSDGQERHVEPLREIGHLVEERGVAGEVDAAAPTHDIAESLGAGTSRTAGAVVTSRRRGDAERADFLRVPYSHLCDGGEAPTAQPFTRAGRRQKAGAGSEQPQRGEIEVVAMHV